MRISVVVLTFNRNDFLRECLASILTGQPSLPDEIIIVNAGAQDVEMPVKPYRGRGVDIKVVLTDNRSVTYNRNVGIRTSSGDLVAFTDDDCAVCPGWIEKYLEAFRQNDNIGSAGGGFIDINPDRLAKRLEEMSMKIRGYYNSRNTPFCHYFQTANVCYSRKALESIGLFDEDFKRTAGEDLEVGLKLLLAGYQNVYCPNIYVRQYGRNFQMLVRRLFAYGSDLCSVMKRFRGTRFEHLYRMGQPSVYFIASVFTGAVTDGVRFKKEMNFFVSFFYSFLLKIFVNAGILYERWSGR